MKLVPGKVTEVSAAVYSKAKLPMLVRELQPDMSTAFKAVANWNARYPISVRPEGSAIVCKVLQYRKASAAIAVSDDGKMTCPFASGVMAQPPRVPGRRSSASSHGSSGTGEGRPGDRIELAVVAAGARKDVKQNEEALLTDEERRCLYVGNLPFNAEAGDVEDYLPQLGPREAGLVAWTFDVMARVVSHQVRA